MKDLDRFRHIILTINLIKYKKEHKLKINIDQLIYHLMINHVTKNNTYPLKLNNQYNLSLLKYLDIIHYLLLKELHIKTHIKNMKQLRMILIDRNRSLGINHLIYFLKHLISIFLKQKELYLLRREKKKMILHSYLHICLTQKDTEEALKQIIKMIIEQNLYQNVELEH